MAMTYLPALLLSNHQLTRLAHTLHLACCGILFSFCLPSANANPTAITCRGMCDASAVVPLGSEHFVVADDEDNILRVYSRTHGGLPLHTFDLSSFLRVDPKSPEVDLEGTAPMGDRVYWISSHARNKDGKERVSRRRLFATTLSEVNGTFTIQPVGRPYLSLLTDLLQDPRLKPFNLATAARRAPKSKNALNIEGLCATPEGDLLIGFRNRLIVLVNWAWNPTRRVPAAMGAGPWQCGPGHHQHTDEEQRALGADPEDRIQYPDDQQADRGGNHQGRKPGGDVALPGCGGRPAEPAPGLVMGHHVNVDLA